MTTGLRSTFVIGCTQTEIDGVRTTGMAGLAIGAHWRWSGQELCLENPNDLVLLGGLSDQAEVQRRAGLRVRKLVGHMVPLAPDPLPETDGPDSDGQLAVTDGQETFVAMIVRLPLDKCLYVFQGQRPQPDHDYRVISVRQSETRRAERPYNEPKAMVCFGPGAMVATPAGVRPIESIGAGDQVLTRDDGAQPIIWAGHSDVPAQTLSMCPSLRAVRVSQGAYGTCGQGHDLILSPGHRVLLTGAVAAALFGTHEVLVPAEHLIDDMKIRRQPKGGGQRYHHIMFERHQVIWANGVPCESFHPADADLLGLSDHQRLDFIDVAEDVFRDVSTYGGPARRCLTGAETEIFKHGL